MKSFKNAAIGAGAALAVMVAGVGPVLAADAYFAIGTAKATGSWYPLGAALSKVINDKTSGISASVEATKGGMANVHHLAKGEFETALVPSWAILDAMKGTAEYAGKKGFPAKVAGWFAFAPNYLTIMVPNDSGIQSIKDFQGKRINLGAPGTFNRPILQMVLETYGIGTSKVEGFDIAVSPAANRMKNRQLDAIWWWSANPASAFTDASVSIDTRLVGVEPKMIDTLTGKFPWFKAGVIKGGIYKGSDADVRTIFTKITAAMTMAVNEDTAYKVTKAVFENLGTLGQLHPIFKRLTKENALEGLAIPLHPGVAKYFKEVGVPGLDAFMKEVGKL